MWAYIMGGGEGTRVSMKELCVRVQRFCALKRCSDDVWEAVYRLMDIPIPKPDGRQWREWLKEWCRVAGQPIRYLPYQSIAVKRWLVKYCIDRDSDEFLEVLQLLLANVQSTAIITPTTLDLELLGFVQEVAPRNTRRLRWENQLARIISEVESKNKPLQVAFNAFLLSSETYSAMFNADKVQPKVDKYAALEELADYAATYRYIEVLEWVVRHHKMQLANWDNKINLYVWQHALWRPLALGNRVAAMETLKWISRNTREVINPDDWVPEVFQRAATRDRTDAIEFLFTEHKSSLNVPVALEKAIDWQVTRNAGLMEPPKEPLDTLHRLRRQELGY